MFRTKILFYFCLAAGCVSLLQPASAQSSYNVILHGKVQMKDGSPPPKSMGTERVCTDTQGSGPGPLTDKKGEFTWRMDVDPMRTRKCFIHATSSDYSSSEVDISALKGVDVNVTLDPIILSPKMADPELTVVTDNLVPGKSKAAWKAGMAAGEKADLVTAEKEMKTASENSPKFVGLWHILGVIQLHLGKDDDAIKSFEQSLAADPKFVQSYVLLARLQVKTKNWDGAAKTAEAELAMDKKDTYPEVHLHLAVARYEKKDLAGAETAVREALTPKNDGKVTRAEYVLGRILMAKGDAAGAREHMAKYLKMEPRTPDKNVIEAFMATIDKPGAAQEPPLEIIP